MSGIERKRKRKDAAMKSNAKDKAVARLTLKRVDSHITNLVLAKEYLKLLPNLEGKIFDMLGGEIFLNDTDKKSDLERINNELKTWRRQKAILGKKQIECFWDYLVRVNLALLKAQAVQSSREAQISGAAVKHIFDQTTDINEPMEEILDEKFVFDEKEIEECPICGTKAKKPPRIKDVKFLKDRKLVITFKNNERRLLNLRDYFIKDAGFKEIMEDDEAFMLYSFDDNGICWDESDNFTLDNEMLYNECSPYKEENPAVKGKKGEK